MRRLDDHSIRLLLLAAAALLIAAALWLGHP